MSTLVIFVLNKGLTVRLFPWGVTVTLEEEGWQLPDSSQPLKRPSCQENQSAAREAAKTSQQLGYVPAHKSIRRLSVW